MTAVKVCGLTREADVALAASLGVWALGFVLTASPRRVSRARVARLVAHAGEAATGPTPLTVLVFATEPVDAVAQAVAHSGAGAGPTRIIAAADVPDASAADWILHDARAPGAYGGTGRTLDWQALAARLHPDRGSDRTEGRPATDAPGAALDRLVLAGGLTPDNVAQALRLVRPFAVDACSGLEAAPGVKHPDRLRRFVAAVADDDRRSAVRRPADARPPEGRPAGRRPPRGRPDGACEEVCDGAG